MVQQTLAHYPFNNGALPPEEKNMSRRLHRTSEHGGDMLSRKIRRSRMKWLFSGILIGTLLNQWLMLLTENASFFESQLASIHLEGLTSIPSLVVDSTTIRNTIVLANTASTLNSSSDIEPTENDSTQPEDSNDNMQQDIVFSHDTSISFALSNETSTCRIVVENKEDFHYETLESIALLYPLPWEQFPECATSGQALIVVDFSMAQDSDKIAKGEKESWMNYFQTYLAKEIRQRSDGRWIQFGDIVDYNHYPHAYSAYIGASCDFYTFQPWLRKNSRAFCVMHKGECKEYCNRSMIARTCMVSPLHKRCHFLPSKFPTFPERPVPSASHPLRICVSGHGRNHWMLSDALRHLRPANVVLRIHQRSESPLALYDHFPIPLEVVRESDFYQFQQSMAQCHLMLPMIDPETNINYFPQGERKLSGVIPQAVAYKTPMVLHAELISHYEPYLTAPCMVYHDHNTFTDALELMIQQLLGNITTSTVLATDTNEDLPQCHIAIENRVDYHYEILLSIAIRYPLNWTKLGCNPNKPILVDIAPVQPSPIIRNNIKPGAILRNSWIRYFERDLQGTVRRRIDGHSVQFASLVSYYNYTIDYHAIIDASCGFDVIVPWQERSNRTYCVWHTAQLDLPDHLRERSCWLNPMYKPDCFFLPVDLPPFPARALTDPAQICVSGKRRDHDLLAVALSKLEPTDAVINLFVTNNRMPHEYTNRNVTQYIKLVNKPEFLDFQEAVSKCDLILPLLRPVRNSEYFTANKRSSRQMLTGSIIQSIAYRIPTIMHKGLADIYIDYMSAPVFIHISPDVFSLRLRSFLRSHKNQARMNRLSLT
jgi:hypothetical protein